jgi:hypothetical protein
MATITAASLLDFFDLYIAGFHVATLVLASRNSVNVNLTLLAVIFNLKNYVAFGCPISVLESSQVRHFLCSKDFCYF